ncbi:MAG: axeA1 3 [Armatimonadetes bacterium]|jgi:acetyl esterase/lipase|nr:axeA1 3 [Armatimonadota bacterium]
MKKQVWIPALVLGVAALLAPVATHAAEKPLVVPVWPGTPPSEKGPIGPEADMTKDSEGKVAGRRLMRLGNVSTPILEVYRPAKSLDTGASVVIAPGGGYHILAWDLEGTEVAEWLNTLGITGIVLKYRVPRRPGDPSDQPPLQPLQDAQRALSLVRSKAKEWNLDPERIGILGFSAGGHLAARTATNSDRRAYDAIDDVDKVSCKANFAVLVYPAYLANKEGNALMPEIRVSKDTPPTFMAHAGNDPITPVNSALMYLALKQVGVPAELHIYPTGGHGYGLRPTEETVTSWPQRCEEWLRKQGLLKKK